MSNVKIQQIGYLATDPEMSYFDDGDGRAARVKFVVMSNHRYSDQEKTIRIYWVLWRAIAENAMKYLGRGSHVFISGHVENYDFEDRDGNMRYGFNFICDELEYLDSEAASKLRKKMKAFDHQLENEAQDDFIDDFIADLVKAPWLEKKSQADISEELALAMLGVRSEEDLHRGVRVEDIV